MEQGTGTARQAAGGATKPDMNKHIPSNRRTSHGSGARGCMGVCVCPGGGRGEQIHRKDPEEAYSIKNGFHVLALEVRQLTPRFHKSPATGLDGPFVVVRGKAVTNLERIGNIVSTAVKRLASGVVEADLSTLLQADMVMVVNDLQQHGAAEGELSFV